jgi:hypothetical protein
MPINHHHISTKELIILPEKQKQKKEVLLQRDLIHINEIEIEFFFSSI